MVLDAVSLTLAAGEIVDVRGPSGAGKTTLLRACARLLPHASGTLSLSGRLATEFSPVQWRRHVTLLPQVTSLLPGTVRDNLLIPWKLKVRAYDDMPSEHVLEGAMAEVGLAEVALDRDASQLSVGQAARLALLRVALTSPEVLLLDEPDANLDDDTTAQVTAIIERFASGGGAVLRVRHQRDDGSAARMLELKCGSLREVSQ